MEDIAQKLLSKIQSSLEYDIGNSKKLKELAAKIDKGMATYDELNDYAYELGGMLSKAYDTNLSSDVLPDGRMDYDIADNIITPTFTNNYDMAADAAVDVQKQINLNNGIGLNAIRPEFNSDRIDGVVDSVSKADVFDDIKGFLQSAAVNYTQSVIDDTIKANAEFQHKAGLNAKIKRYPTSKCCKWCASLAGVYEYPDVPKDVYRRHQNCNCKLEFIPGKGKKQDVWTKEWINESEYKAQRKAIGIENKCNIELKKGKEVTKEYYNNRFPGQGELIYGKGYNISGHKEEIEIAKWINKNLGGNIELLAESDVDGVKMPDYIWNNKYWELKTTTTEKSANSAVRKAIKQISDNPGGIILNYNSDINIQEVINVIEKRVDASKDNRISFDIMVLVKNKIATVIRY